VSELYGEIGDNGFLKISNQGDREAVATILYRNGYTVDTKRRKKNGKAFEYYVHYEMKGPDIQEGN
jgi:hypothetical protein